ncbi:putative 2-aminoethylphosphonate ABC transporter permease subunit [Halobacillus salinarum]|uniref:2-aminoethylphosphonate ABC transporter permease subunit n=1 Tax=Halobacillus salinarum TaxID=2932257 RepID=A0ABY4EFR3_9BACI|nr:putative 2-aminoethylphosphonate ABC transporter permease subunit [Halobacillus salinarum]UOQ43305.1 putative 2-aminoethylphosphonate ABC transporter permease subunit [Halobacillus salinarum]
MRTAIKTMFHWNPVISQKEGKDQFIQRLLIILMLSGLLIAIVLPFSELLIRALQNKQGEFAGLLNFADYFTSPSLFISAVHTIMISTLTMGISVVAAFLFAYGIERTKVKGKSFFTYIGLLPLFAPTMMYGIALLYLFGNNGLITTGFFGAFKWMQANGFEIYGFKGIVISEVIFTFPQAFLILKVALSAADQRLYEAADSMGAGKLRQFFTVTLPSTKYGLVSALFVCFTLSFTDFGAPKVIGGQYNVLATDVYKQVIGQQNFSMGATVGIILTIPAVIAFFIDQVLQRKKNQESGLSIPYRIPTNKKRDQWFTIYCSIIAAGLLLLFGTITAAAFVKVWPYDFSLTFNHFGFNSVAGDGLRPYWNSLLVSFFTAVLGTVMVFSGAYLIEKSRFAPLLRRLSYFLSIFPIALPGLVIGLAFIFFFNKQVLAVPFTGLEIANPFQWLYGSLAILVLANIIHFYSVSFITATTSLKKQDRQYEAVSEAMNVPFYRTFAKITVPLSMPAILEIAMYLFVNSMTTISAVVFLYSPEWKLASIAIVNMDDAGDIAPAAAMAILIVITNIVVRVVYGMATKQFAKKSNAWKHVEKG